MTIKATTFLLILGTTILINRTTTTSGQISSTPAVLAPDADKFQNISYAWIRHGQLALKRYSYNGRNCGVLYYQNSDKEWIILQNNIGGLNQVFSEEVKDRQLATQILLHNLARFVLSTMAPTNSLIIDRDLVKGDAGISPALDSPQPAPAVQEALHQKLLKYALDAYPKVTSNSWTLTLNILTQQGGVEHWIVTGKVEPLNIVSFSREILESDKTFYPRITTD